jgi:hypothetical protein
LTDVNPIQHVQQQYKMGQVLSGQYLINTTKKQIVHISRKDFSDKNIYNSLKKINEINDWSFDDTVEYINADAEKQDDTDYIKELVTVQNYKIDPMHFPNEWINIRIENNKQT